MNHSLTAPIPAVSDLKIIWKWKVSNLLVTILRMRINTRLLRDKSHLKPNSHRRSAILNRWWSHTTKRSWRLLWMNPSGFHTLTKGNRNHNVLNSFFLPIFRTQSTSISFRRTTMYGCLIWFIIDCTISDSKPSLFLYELLFKCQMSWTTRNIEGIVGSGPMSMSLPVVQATRQFMCCRYKVTWNKYGE